MNQVLPLEDQKCVSCVIPEFLLQIMEFFNPYKSYPPDYTEKYNESITLYEYSLDILFINESDNKNIKIPTNPIEMDGRECHRLGASFTVSRKVSDDDYIRLLMTFEDNTHFGDTHKLIDGTVYFGKNKFTVKECTIYRNFMVDKKLYEFIAMCTFK